jgi:hypothetical protein
MRKIKDISKAKAIENSVLEMIENDDRKRKIQVVSILLLAVISFVIGMGVVLTSIPGWVDAWLGL